MLCLIRSAHEIYRTAIFEAHATPRDSAFLHPAARLWIGSGLYSIPIDLIRYDTGGSCESTDTIRYDTFEMWWWCIGAYLDICNPCLLRPKVSSDGPLRPKLGRAGSPTRVSMKATNPFRLYLVIQLTARLRPITSNSNSNSKCGTFKHYPLSPLIYILGAPNIYYGMVGVEPTPNTLTIKSARLPRHHHRSLA